MSNTTVPSPPFLSNQRGVSDDAITRRSDTQRSLPNQRSPTADRQTGNRSTSFRSSTFGSLFRSRIDVDSANATPSMPPPAQQQQHRPNSAYYPSQQTMNRPSSSQQGNGSHRPVSASFASQQSVRPTQQGIMPPNNSYSYSGMPGGMPAPLPNPYDPSYTPSSFGPPQQQSYQHPPTSAPSSFSNFNRPPPMSAPASYGSQMQHQQQQQGGNNYHYPHNQAISSPPLPPPPAESDADLEAVIRASQESAAEESRKREERQRVEEEHYLALHKSEEQERQRKQAEEEEEMLLKAMQASQLEEEELRRKRLQREKEEEEAAQILLEESRQSALREEEERMKRQHAELIERSKLEAEEEEKKRNHAIEQERLMEEAAMKASLRELEEEWKRREEEERADALHIQQGGQIGDVSYWQNLDEKKAFRLAMEMNKRFDHQSNNVASTSSSSNSAIIRPLPPTPGMAALAAGVELPKMHVINEQGETVVEGDQEEQEWELSDDELIEGEREDDVDDDGQDPFSDKAEAPPMYDDVGNDRPPEAPTSIPSNIQFVRPDYGTQPEHNNTIASMNYPSEKSAAISSNTTPPSDAISSTSSHLEQNGIPSHSRPNMTFSHLEQNVTNRSSSKPSRPLPKPRVSSKVLPTLPSVSESSQAPSITITDASSSSQTHSTNQTQETDTTNTPTEESNEFQQRAMKGTDFGYSSEPFGTELFLQESGSNEISTSEPKTRFPNLISLRKANVDGSLRDHSCFFIVRAPSWKALVRALAWYGNTRIEAGPEEVVDHGNSIALRIVIEFVTPSKTSWSQTTIHQNQIAHVSVCFSLAIPSLKEESSKDLLTALKQSSHALDSAYLRQGVTRRVIALPSEAPKLPLDMVNLAQILHRAHTFSAACPSTGATALHSPRDLHHAVERHDVGYVAKLQKKRRDVLATTTTSIPVNNMASTSSNTNGTGKRISSNGENYKRQSGVLQPSNLANNVNSGSSNNNNQTNSIGDGMKLPDLTEGGDIDNNDVDQNDGQGDILDAGAVEIVDGDDYGSGRMARLRAHVHRRLGKRSGDPRTVDQDLESWITPYDMTQHG